MAVKYDRDRVNILAVIANCHKLRNYFTVRMVTEH